MLKKTYSTLRCLFWNPPPPPPAGSRRAVRAPVCLKLAYYPAAITQETYLFLLKLHTDNKNTKWSILFKQQQKRNHLEINPEIEGDVWGRLNECGLLFYRFISYTYIFYW